nr:hypothetical protein [uncultured archaeon]
MYLQVLRRAFYPAWRPVYLDLYRGESGSCVWPYPTSREWWASHGDFRTSALILGVWWKTLAFSPRMGPRAMRYANFGSQSPTSSKFVSSSRSPFPSGLSRPILGIRLRREASLRERTTIRSGWRIPTVSKNHYWPLRRGIWWQIFVIKFLHTEVSLLQFSKKGFYYITKAKTVKTMGLY